MLTFDLTGSNALSRVASRRLTVQVKDPDGSARSLAGHTCRAVARPSYGHETSWFDLSVGSGITLADGQIEVVFPEISTVGGEQGMRGVWDAVLKAADGTVVVAIGGTVEVEPSAQE